MNEVLSVYRSENKYFINLFDAANLESKFDKILSRDNFSLDGSYIVRSLYFDSIDNLDYYTKLSGEEKRKKIRIRVYDPNSEKCKLELKEKIGDLQHKVSIWIEKKEAYDLINGRFDTLVKYIDKSKDALRLYTEMVLGCYKPVVMVEYDRVAFTHPLYNTRITFDMNIRTSESDFDLFKENINYSNLPNEQVILEVKYNGRLLDFISTLLKPYSLTRIAVSKYCLSRKIFLSFNY